MKRNINSFVNGIFRSRRRTKAIARMLLLVMAFNAAFTAIILGAQSSSAIGEDEQAVLLCGYDYEHEHGQGCYERVFTCELEEGVGHEHGDECIGEVTRSLICEEEEIEGHEHSDECYEERVVYLCDFEEDGEHTHSEECGYDIVRDLICEEEEVEGHEHSDECYIERTEYICGLEEGEGGHTHEADCWETNWDNLVCEILQHTHSDDCYLHQVDPGEKPLADPADPTDEEGGSADPAGGEAGGAGEYEDGLCYHVHDESCYGVPNWHICNIWDGCIPDDPNAQLDDGSGLVRWTCGYEPELICPHLYCVYGEPCLDFDGTDLIMALEGDTVTVSNITGLISNLNEPGVTTINISGGSLTVPSGEYALESVNQGVTIHGRITVNSGATLIIGNDSSETLVINGGGEGDVSVITVNSGGTLILNGGTITNGTGSNGGNSGGDIDGGGVYVNGGTFNMNGGSISNNKAKHAGGGVNISNSGVFNMYGGVISNNTATGSGGGGVNISTSSVFNMYGGYISNNMAKGNNGGGVYVHGNNGAFNMYGGTISYNIASKNQCDGGGVSIEYPGKVTIYAGYFYNNTCTQHGGAIGTGYSKINGDSNTIVYNPVIAGNKANKNNSGGGMYACPDGSLVNLKNYHTAIFDNVTGSGKAKNDICVDKTSNNTFIVPEYMINGVSYGWNYANGNPWTGGNNASDPYTATTKPYTLSDVITYPYDVNNLGEEQEILDIIHKLEAEFPDGRVFIVNNVAGNSGGGIGGNGSYVVIGDNNQETTGQLLLKKMVDGDEADQDKDFTFTVTFSNYTGIKMNGAAISNPQTVNLKHGQSVAFTDIPAGTGYTVAEGDHTGYTLTWSGDGTVDVSDGNKVTGTVAESSCVAVTAKNTKTTVTAYNFSFTKTQADGTTLLPGAQFTLYEDSSCANVVATSTDSNGTITFSNIPAYTYYMKETTTPTGYQENNTVYMVVVTSSGTTITGTGVGGSAGSYSIANTPIPETGTLTLKKVVSGGTATSFNFTVTFTGDGLDFSGITSDEFTISDNGATWTGALTHDETVTFENIPLGATYTITEDAAANYTPSYASSNAGAITSTTKDVSVICTNTYTPPSVIIRGKKEIDTTNMPSGTFTFTFNLTQVTDAIGATATSGGIIRTATVTLTNGVLSPADGKFEFPEIGNLTEGEYWYKITEDRSSVPANWAYDTIEYIVRVVVTNGHAVVYYPYYDGGNTINGGVVTAGEQTIDIEPTVVDVNTANLKHDDKSSSYDYFNGGGSNDTYLYNINKAEHPIAFRCIYDTTIDNIVIGAAYCIDMYIHAIDKPYEPYEDFNGFKNRYKNTYEEILWLTRNGFMSEGNRASNTGEWNGDNNLSAIKALTGINGLTADEAYCATQFAIWHFSENITWGFDSGYYQIYDSWMQSESTRIYDAYVALVAAATRAADSGEAITQITLGVHFDIPSDPTLNSGWYGPITVNVDLLPIDTGINKNTIPVVITLKNGIYLSSGANLDPGLTATELTLYHGNQFWVYIGTGAISGEIDLVKATATLKTSVTVKDVFILNNQSTSGSADWTAAQAVTGIGAMKRAVDLSTTATLSVSSNTDFRLQFTNKYTPPTPPSATINGKKTVSGIYAPEQEFTFTLTQVHKVENEWVEKNPATVTGVPQTKKVPTNGAGDYTFSFDEKITGLKISTTYYFMVKETPPDPLLLGWTYDENEYIVVVVVDATGKVDVYYPQPGDADAAYNDLYAYYPQDKNTLYYTGSVYDFQLSPTAGPTDYPIFDLFCADKFLGAPGGQDIEYFAFHSRIDTSSALVYALFHQLVSSPNGAADLNKFLQMFGFKQGVTYPFLPVSGNNQTIKEKCRELTAFLIWYFELRDLYPESEYNWDPWDLNKWPENLPEKIYPYDTNKKLIARTGVASGFSKELHNTWGIDYSEIFAIAVETIDAMMKNYNTTNDGNCITSIEILYEPESLTSGWLSFSYDGFNPYSHPLTLEWTTNLDMTVTIYNADGEEIFSGAAEEYSIPIFATDKFYIEHDGTGSVKFTIKDDLYYPMNGSIEGKYYISVKHNSGVDLNYQRMLVGRAAFGKVESTIEIGRGNCVTFKNTYGTTDLVLTKNIEGNSWEEGETFTFDVIFDSPVICVGETSEIDEGKVWKITLTYDKRGVKFTNIPLGTTYTIIETQKNGYECTGIGVINGDRTIELPERKVIGTATTTLTIHVTYTNARKSFELPRTGGPGVLPFTIIGGLLIAITSSCAFLYYRKLESERVRKTK